MYRLAETKTCVHKFSFGGHQFVREYFFLYIRNRTWRVESTCPIYLGSSCTTFVSEGFGVHAGMLSGLEIAQQPTSPPRSFLTM